MKIGGMKIGDRIDDSNIGGRSMGDRIGDSDTDRMNIGGSKIDGRIFSRRQLYVLLLRLRWALPVWRRVDYIGGSDVLPPPLPGPEEKRLLEQMAAGDHQSRQSLIEHNLRLVVYIARKFENTGVNIEDLISIGTIGLIKAVNTFDPGKKIKLATYASRCIENEILMFLRRHTKTRAEVSLDEPLNTDWDGNELLLSDILGTDGDTVYRSIEEEMEKRLLFAAMGKLTKREKIIMESRFGLGGREEMTQKEVAELLGISQSYISRLEKRIIRKLQKEIVKAE